ncbi:hypothetical protein PV721_28345 [Streptomyces sp. MB09-01]|uniref:hypothetical protein n=1 Tax=Streptomyces sp. MB09-01 TaxID=3028666 RepID=UPI0029B47EFA|nr:hypothetical protein [Streptomyces sp. MB09-01]MDX3538187.1 hypothetical protein [Streptomyces sp. MB09-01]
MTEHPDEAAVEAAHEPHDPAPGERAAVDRVRAEADGMGHHQAEAALEAAREEGADPAVVAEWERIEEHLAAHRGPYAPAADPFLQGLLTARTQHGTG